MKRLSFASRGFYKRLEQFSSDAAQQPEVSSVVAEIIAAVRKDGDKALLHYTSKFDGLRCSAADLRVSEEEIAAAGAALPAGQRKRIRQAIRNVRFFHRHGVPRDWTAVNPDGAVVGERWYPIERVGIYVPAGNVPLVSTVVMTTTLAQMAGVKSIAVATPAGRDGQVSPQMLAGLALCGVTEVYRIGGAQAMAALALGTATIERVCKLMGPGNAYVAEAQRQLFGEVGVDLLPGPSEALLIADSSARASWIAADLLAQAEHGSGRERVYFVYTDADLAMQVSDCVRQQLPGLRHAAAVKKIWQERTCFIHVPDLDAAAQVANFVAPEHLELHVGKRSIQRLLRQITTAGAILCGHDTPTVLGDFTAGPSHTLPTARTGRFFSGLMITHFMRRSSVVQYDKASLARAREVVRVFAELEDLDAHGLSMESRFEEEGADGR